MSKKQPTEDMLNKVLADFNAAWEYTSGSWHSRWKDNHDLYNGNRVKRGYQGITDTFVPMCFSTVETLTSALFGTKPKYAFLAPNTNPDQKTDILNSLVDYYWDKDQWSLKNIHVGRSMCKLGTGVAYYYWENDHPCKIVVPIRDFFIDPTVGDGETARYMGRRYLTTKEELESFEIIDLDNPMQDVDPMTGEVTETFEMKKKYTKLDKIDSSGAKGDNTDKQEKDMWYGSTVGEPEKNQIEVIEWWTMDKVVSVANRSVVIEDAENYFKAKARTNGVKYPKGIMPFAWARDYVDESLFFAKGEIDIIADEQELLNDITNQSIDSTTFSLNQMYTLDPAYADQINEVENIPGAVYPFPAGTLMPIQQRPVPPDAYNERQNIKNEIRETTASNEVIKGVGEQGGKSTATEINAQIAGAGQRINLKVTQLENEYFHREARIILQLIKLYVTEPMMVRILGKDGARWEEFDPSEFQGDYEPRVQLDISVQQKRQEDAKRAQDLLAAFLGDPDINQQELKKMVLQRSFELDPDEVESLIMPMPPMDPMMGGDPMMDPAMAGMDPSMMGMPEEDMMMPPMQPQAGMIL